MTPGSVNKMLKLQTTSTEIIRYKYKICHDVKADIQNIYRKSVHTAALSAQDIKIEICMCMHYKYTSSSRGQKSTCIVQEDFTNDVNWTRCLYPNEK